MKLRLIDLENNPFRDFKLYPIDLAQVSALRKSIEELGFWGGVTARPHPHTEDVWQIAAGHHRIDAAIASGLVDAEIDVQAHDDDHMVKIMVKENLTQRGYNAAAIADSVAAIALRVAVIVLGANELSEISEGLLTSDHAFNQAKKSMLKDGPGVPILLAYSPELKRSEVEAALASLKASGKMADIMDHATKEVKFALLHKNKDLASEVMEAEEAITVVEEVGGTAKELKEAQKKLTAAKKKQVEEAEQFDALDDMMDTLEAKPVTYDERVPSAFKKASHEKAFREAMHGETGRKFIPVDKQYKLAKAVQKHLDEVPSNRLSGASEVQRYIHEKVFAPALGLQLKIDKEEAQRLLAASMTAKVEDQWKTVERGLNMSHSALAALKKLYDDWDDELNGPMIPFDEGHKTGVKQTCEALLKLLKNSF